MSGALTAVAALLTLIAAGLAALYAKRAASAAQASLELERKVAQLEHCPNVHIDSVDVDYAIDSKGPKVSFRVNNSGTTIARNFKVTAGWAYKSEPPDRLALCALNIPAQLAAGTGQVIEVPATKGHGNIGDGDLYCEFFITWEEELSHSGETVSRSLGEMHRCSGKEFKFWADTQADRDGTWKGS